MVSMIQQNGTRCVAASAAPMRVNAQLTSVGACEIVVMGLGVSAGNSC